jgi:nucleotide-binding universal stress UspA family protein
MSLYERILVAYDGSEPSRQALDEAIRVVKAGGGTITVVHAIGEPFLALGSGAFVAGGGDLIGLAREAAEETLRGGVQRVLDAGLPAESLLLDTFEGRVCELIAEAAARRRADLIVIGSHGRRGLSRALLGSDAEQILRLAPVPVLLVRAPARA